VIPDPSPLSAKNPVKQSDTLKTANRTPSEVAGPGGSSMEMRFSPNVPGRVQPSYTAPPPVDMEALFTLMRKAEDAILFLVFLPSKGGLHSIVSEAVDLGLKDTSLMVTGAISDSQAMWQEPGGSTNGAVPHVFQQGGVSVIRATALSDKAIVEPIGNFALGEQLAAEHAIIHDKILVLDPLDSERCVVAFGSHNLGYKASYANDENLTIVRGNRALAEVYATHVLDVYDHYRFRAFQADSTAANRWDGQLHRTDTWQEKSSRRLARYLGAMP
jgi:phosphatidylserine/phosphatidylglycerophosphate/cardiolipin synthase-like enzyme